jgi:hypothetical protein
MLPLTIPLADIPMVLGPITRNPSTIEPSAASRITPAPEPEIDPFRTAIPCSSPEAGAASIPEPPGALIPLSEKPARSMLTRLAVIARQLFSTLVVTILWTSLYEPGSLIVWHFSISVGPSRASCACAPARGARIIAPRASATGKSAAGLLMLSSLDLVS